MALIFWTDYAQPIWATLAYYDPACGPANQNFRKRGWWELERGTGQRTIWDVDLRTVNRFAYCYAESAHDGASWSGTGNGWLSVTPNSGFDECALHSFADDQWVDFAEMDFRWAPPGWDLVVGFVDLGQGPELEFYPQKIG